MKKTEYRIQESGYSRKSKSENEPPKHPHYFRVFVIIFHRVYLGRRSVVAGRRSFTSNHVKKDIRQD